MKFSDLVKHGNKTPAPAPAAKPAAPPPAPPPNNPFAALRQTMQQPAAPPPPQPAIAADPMDAIANTQMNPALQMGEFPGQGVDVAAPATEQLQQRLRVLEASMNSDQLDGQLTETLIYLDKNPELHAVLAPADINTFVRALRSVYGTVIAKKAENKSKRRVTNEKVEEATGDLDELGF